MALCLYHFLSANLCVSYMQTSFSDWSPVLMASEVSLELLNSKLDTALLMERFRPNVVLSGCLPHAEVYRIAGIFRGYKFSRMDLYKGFYRFYFRGLGSSLLAHAHINMQLYLHTVSLESRLSLYKIIESVRHYVLHL